MSGFTYVANWKMNLSFKQAEQFYQEHWQEIETLAHASKNKIILCPSFVALHIYRHATQHTKNIFLGAQDCSPFTAGAYTGDTDALSIRQIGCTFCIVGHIERRRLHGESNELVAEKAAQLQLNGITPIVCIGETAEQKTQGETTQTLQRQLKPVLTVTAATGGSLYIAYEPIWAIGAGTTPTTAELTDTLQMIRKYVEQYTALHIPLLYGGGVTADTITQIKNIPLLSGILIGSASTDFNSLKKIVF